MVAQRPRRYPAPGVALCLAIALSPSMPAGEPEDSGIRVSAILIPTGYRDGVYSTMLQVVVPGSPLSDASWELGASVGSSGASSEFSGSVVTAAPWTPAVLEIMVTMPAGPYEIALTARETTAGRSAEGRLIGKLPSPESGSATVSPIALLQPGRGSFLRDASTRTQGAIGRADDEPVQSQLATALVSVVCRWSAQQGTLFAVRRLVGSTSVEFDPIEMPAGGDRCAQVRDLIPAGTIAAGSFRYEVKVVDDGQVAASGSRLFEAVESAGGPSGATARPGG